MRFRFFLSSLVIAIAVVGGLFGFSRWYRAYQHPYGWTHACDLQLYMDLTNYADSNQGFFPRGEATPEASLSLLYRSDPTMAYLLAGKSAPVDNAEMLIAAGKLLTPESCSWHYVEGLHKNDNPKLALFWDKVGLDHNGRRMPPGGHSVVRLNGTRAWVSAEEWPQFLEEQKQLLPDRPGISPTVLEQR